MNLEVSLQAVGEKVSWQFGAISIKGADRDAVLLNGKTPDFFVGHGDEFDTEDVSALPAEFQSFTCAVDKAGGPKTAEQIVGTSGRAPVRGLRIQNSIDRRSCHGRPAKQEMRAHSMPLQCSARPTVLQPSMP